MAATDLAGPLHSVRYPILSDSAARAFFTGGSAPLPRMPSEAASQATASRSLLRRELAGGEASEDVLEELTRHACAMARPSECAVLLARWTASYPDSPRLAQAAGDLRFADYTGAGVNVLRASAIETFVELYRGHSLTDPESPGPVRNAITTSSIYASNYLHAFPFDRTAVRRAWSVCASDQRMVLPCTTERRQAEQELGPIYRKSAPH